MTRSGRCRTRKCRRAFSKGCRRSTPISSPTTFSRFASPAPGKVYAVTTLNYSDRLPAMITSVPGLAIVNSAHIVNASLAVNETVSLAEAALPRLLEAADVSSPELASYGQSIATAV